MKKVAVNGNEVAIEFDLEEPHPSSTGRSQIRYTTGGYLPLPGSSGLLISINVIERIASRQKRGGAASGRSTGAKRKGRAGPRLAPRSRSDSIRSA